MRVALVLAKAPPHLHVDAMSVRNAEQTLRTPHDGADTPGSRRRPGNSDVGISSLRGGAKLLYCNNRLISSTSFNSATPTVRFNSNLLRIN